MSKWSSTLKAYAAAEERLLDVFSPPADAQDIGVSVAQCSASMDAEMAATTAKQTLEAAQSLEVQSEHLLDPAVDCVLQIITDNNDIQSLISSADGDEFKGFDDHWPDGTQRPSENDIAGQLIFGLCRSQLHRTARRSEDETSTPTPKSSTCDGFLDCTPPKKTRLSTEEVINIEDSQHASASINFLEVVASQTSSFMANTPAACSYDALGSILMNGDDTHIGENIDIVERSDDMEMQEVIESPSDQPPPQCVIYDGIGGGAGNVVLLTNEQCCEIIVSSHGVSQDQGLARAFLIASNGANTLLELLPEQVTPQHLNGAFITEVPEEESNVDAHNVYLSDAALEQQDQQLYVVSEEPLEHDEEAVVEEEIEPRLVCYDGESDDDPNNENNTFVDDTPLEEDRPDICPVYEDELEDHDDECDENTEEEEDILEQELLQIAKERAEEELRQQQQQQQEQDEHHIMVDVQETITIGSDIESHEIVPPKEQSASIEKQTPLPERKPLSPKQQERDDLEAHTAQPETPPHPQLFPQPTILFQPQTLSQSQPLAQFQPATQPLTISDHDHSSTTEFPVSSSSMPNGSDCDDYDDELADDQLSPSAALPPTTRRYPLLKNTLSAEAMDRKLANICQTQPQMSLSEKMENWDFSVECEAVEDVENFDTTFENHEVQLRTNNESAGSKKKKNFKDFCETLSKNLLKITEDLLQAAGDVSAIQKDEPEADSMSRLEMSARRILNRRQSEMADHARISELTLTKNKLVCQSYKRLLDGMHNSEESNPVAAKENVRHETIVLDDDDGIIEEVVGEDEQNCKEISEKVCELKEAGSSATLVPQEDMKCTQLLEKEEQVFTTSYTQTQTSPVVEQPLVAETVAPLTSECKETSTTDLEHCMPPPPPAQLTPNASKSAPTTTLGRHFADVVLDVMRAQSPKHRTVSQAASPKPNDSNECANVQDALFYEQHEFCNYLGLTELATANAVATAMRELANCTVARRSLRVRTQQQLDRMRNDVRGRRRERRQKAMAAAPPTTSSERSTSATTDKDETTPPKFRRTSEPTSPKLDAVNDPYVHMQSIGEPCKSSSREMFEYYYRAQGDGADPNSKSSSTSLAHNQTLEQAFAQVYAAAAPAESQLHESMQNRLKQARETKPSIYIVQAMSHAATKPTPAVTPRPSLEDRVGEQKHGTVITPQSSPSPTRRSTEPPRQTAMQSQSSPSPKRKKAGGAAANKHGARRSTNAADSSAHKSRKAQTHVYVRDLVTRSTTHLNSKMLRNRRINLLKSYTLSDARTPGRLSGGSAAIHRTRTPKAVKATLKKAVDKAPTTLNTTQLNSQLAPMQREVRQVIFDNNELLEINNPPEQHRLQQQQEIAPSKKTSVRSKATKQTSPGKGGAATAARAQLRQDAKNKLKTVKPVRAKSLPAPLTNTQEKKAADMPLPMPEALVATAAATPKETTQLSKRQLDLIRMATETQDFITKQTMVRPPIQTAASRRFLNNLRKIAEQHLPILENNAGGPPYENVPKPALTYPAAVVVPSPPRTHFSHRRESAGTAMMEDRLPDIKQTPPGGLMRLTSGSPMLRNPLAGKHGKVLYMYYELDQLIVLQEKIITFWKYSKIYNLVRKETTDANDTATQRRAYNAYMSDSERSFGATDQQQWVHLGRVRRITNDVEITAPFANRLCVHNSTPVYVEMRSHALDHNKRERVLLSLYVNVYFYCEEELRPKIHSVHLDAVNCEPGCVLYTTITESRYFIMAWQQEQSMGKPRSGLCKYSLTPTLDTLASIREFKQLRYELKYIECLTEDRFIGYGLSQVAIWDHRSGDMLMNYDFGFELGRNLGAMYYPTFDIDMSSMLILFQHLKEPDKQSELRVIACEMSHATPTHRILHVHRLPSPDFDYQISAINTGDHLILKGHSEGEIWISAADPRELTYVAPQGTQRFYARNKSQVIEVSPHSLMVDSIANHMLKMATHQQFSSMPVQGV
ncbi:uncharacterized protein LOC115622901 [Scaptodrosophila lebanonensis]|uniref:Uncharacterized protein LOC115622901 n=1 Tax=Drosophila lebanonensis TaxID=7225 RepID=A0A6J2TBW7_DROLE|nr:uncharacterized protein LOC115622901 [Scaptodrosophila lebanonensis]